MHRKFAVVLCLTICLSFPNKAFALSCYIPSGIDAIKQYELIFKGRATSTKSIAGLRANSFNSQDSQTTFEVEELIKGEHAEKFTIYHTTNSIISGGSTSFKIGSIYILYVNRSSDGQHYRANPCSPSINLDNIRSGMNASTRTNLLEIEKYQSQKEALNKLIKQFDADEYSIKKIELLVEYKDYSQAQSMYEEIVRRQYKERQAAAKKRGLNGTYGRANYHDMCTGIYASNNNTPDFLQNSTSPPIRAEILVGQKHLLEYSKLLFAQSKYKESLRPLCLSQTTWPGVDRNIRIEAEALNSRALAKLGFTEQLNKKSLDFSNWETDGLNLSDLQLERSDFSNSIIRKIDLNASNLIGANFKGAKFDKLSANKSNFSGANFEESKISGDLSGANLSFVKGKDSYINANLSDADLSNSDFRNAKIMGTLDGANLKNANLQGAYIHSLYGAIIDGTNLNEIQSNDGSFPSRGKNYSNLNLSSLNLKGSQFSSTNFSNSDFSNSDLSKSVLVGSNLSAAKFNNTNLQDADLSSASDAETDISGVDFSTANLNGTKLFEAVYDCTTRFPPKFNIQRYFMKNRDGNCSGESVVESNDLKLVDFLQPPSSHWRLMSGERINLIKESIKFQSIRACEWGSWSNSSNMGKKKHNGADLNGKDFSGCMLGYNDFRGTNLANANFKGAYLYGAHFTGANLQGADFNFARVTDTTRFPPDFAINNYKLIPTSVLNGGESPWQASNLARGNPYERIYRPPAYPIPNLKGEILDELNLTASWLPGSNMETASFRLANLTSSNLKDVNLTNADLTGAVLNDAVLDNANLTKANLYGADLRWTRFRGAVLTDAVLTNALYDYNTEWPEGFDIDTTGAFLVGPEQKPLDLPELDDDDRFTDLPKDYDVLSLGLYVGKSESGGSCGHGDNIQCVPKVSISRKNTPLLLVLSAYEPTTWQLNIEEGVDLRGIILSGMYEQSLQGVAGNIKVVNYSTEESDHRLKFWIKGDDEKNILKMKDVLTALTGKATYRVVPPDDVRNFQID